MAITTLGALRFFGLVADVGSLPIDATLTGAIFDATDEIRKWVFDGTAWQEFVTSSSPLTTKGDLITNDGATDVRLPVGTTDGFVLSVNSVTPTGLEWVAGGGGSSVEGIATVQAPDGTLSKLTATNDGRLELVPSNLPAGLNPIPTFDTITLVKTTTPSDPTAGNATMWTATVDGDNDGVFARIKVDGTFKTVRVI